MAHAGNDTMTVSVIIPTYNSEKSLRECLTALREQSFPADRYEIIVVDDGSTDSTQSTIKEMQVDGRLRSSYQKNQGPAAARNHGARIARGEIIIFTDADCLPRKDFLSQMVEPFERDPQVAGVMGAYQSDQQSFISRFAQVEFENRYRKLARPRHIDLVATYAAAFKRKVFLKLKGFDTGFPVADNEDVEFSYRMASLGYKMVFNPDAIVYHRHPETILAYLRQKFGRAFWRIQVYKIHPGKIIADSYTPQTLKLQILISALIILYPACHLLGLHNLLFPFALAVTFLLSTLPFFFSVFPGKAEHVPGGRKEKARRPASTEPGPQPKPRLRETAGAKLLFFLFALMMIFLRSLAMGLGILLGLQPTMGKQGRTRHLILLMLSDVLAVLFGIVLTYCLKMFLLPGREEIFCYQLPHCLAFSPLPIIFLLVIFYLNGLYLPAGGLSHVNQFLQINKLLLLTSFILIPVLYLARVPYPLATAGLFWTSNLFSINLLRGIAGHLIATRKYFQIEPSNAIILGTGESAKFVWKKLSSRNFPDCNLVGFCSENTGPKAAPAPVITGAAPVLGNIDDLSGLIEEHNIKDVFIALPEGSQERIFTIIKGHRRPGVDFKIISNFFDLISAQIDIAQPTNLPILYLKSEKFGPFQIAVKRLFDFILSLFIILITFPIWVGIILAIKIESRGPAVFKQERVGKNDRIFFIYKFRTMHADVDKFEYAPTGPEDERITNVGRFLRRTSLDELPQLINVLRGEMSLVGPRPEMPFIVKKYKEWERVRLSIKPGLTGLWQILGRKDLPLHENIEYDIYYIKNRSFLMDLTILLQTIPAIVSRKGAY